MKQQIGFITFIFVAMILLTHFATAEDAKADAPAKEVKMVQTSNFEPIKAKIVSDVPSEYTINVKFLTNTFADTEADVFSVYISSTKPENCADFRHLDLSYEKPSKYLRVFDLSENEDVIAAVNQYNCVAIKNIPSN